MQQGGRRLAKELSKDVRPQGAPTGWLEPVTIATVTAGGAADGNALVTVTWRGASVQAAYLSSYTPIVGHVAAAWVSDKGSVLILGRIIGTPPS